MSAAEHLQPQQFTPIQSGRKAWRNREAMNAAAAGHDRPEWGRVPVEHNVDPSTLTPIQTSVSHRKLARLSQLEPYQRPAALVVQAPDGTRYIQDGHHRAHLAQREGHGIPIRVWTPGVNG